MSELGMLNHIFKEDCDIRFLTLQGRNVYYRAGDVARFLGYEKPRNAISRFVEDKDKLEIGERSVRTSPTVYITESAMYKFFMQSNMPKAKLFQEWVCEHGIPIYMRQNNMSTEQLLRIIFG